MKTFNKYGVWAYTVIIAIAGLLVATPGRTWADPPTNSNVNIIAQVAQKIRTGHFDDARTLIERAEGPDPAAEQLARLLAEYDALQARRQAERQKLYKQYANELKQARAKLAEHRAAGTEDLEAIEKVFAAMVKVLNYGTDDQKRTLLDDAATQDLIARARRYAAELETQGQWGQAYSQCYQWLLRFDEHNLEYKAHADELIAKASLAMSLRDSRCEAAIERYKGIRPEMLYRALDALDFKYVATVDYRGMVEKALVRCLLLGDVLESAPDLAFKPPRSTIELWRIGVESIQSEVDTTAAGATKDGFKRAFENARELNTVTIQLPEEVLVAHFTEAALEALDPYTNLVWPQRVQEFQKSIRQEFTGIGIRMSKIGKTLKILSLIPNTPAYKSGLDAGDEIIAVDGEPTAEMTSDCAVRKISGRKGTPVTLTVKRADNRTVEDITIIRDRIVVPTVEGQQRADSGSKRGRWRHMIDPANRIGYVRVSSFVEQTVEQMDATLDELERQQLQGLILDLRSNSGGLLAAAIGMVDLFIDRGLILRSQPRRFLAPSLWMAHEKGTHPDYPLVVLVDGASASASEIVAGALQDPSYRRAVLVGTRSYGKGSVQEITDFTGYGSQFKFTTAYYHLPSGQPVRNRYVAEREGRTDWGIAPDVEVELRPDEQERLFKLQSANQVLTGSSHDPNQPPQRYTLEDTLAADPQLAVALLVVKSELIRSGRTVDFEVTAKAPDPQPAVSTR